MIGTKEVRNFINGSPTTTINDRIEIVNANHGYKIYMLGIQGTRELITFTTKIDVVLDYLVENNLIDENSLMRKIRKNFWNMLGMSCVVSMYLYILMWWITNDRLWILH